MVVATLSLSVTGAAQASIQGADLGLSPNQISGNQPYGLDALNADAVDKALERLLQDEPAPQRLASGSGDASTGGASSSSSRSVPKPISPPKKEPSDEESPQYALLQSSGTSNSTTSTSSSAGVSFGVSLAAFPQTTLQLADDLLIEHYAAERSLSLPDALGTELLRPPQG